MRRNAEAKEMTTRIFSVIVKQLPAGDRKKTRTFLVELRSSFDVDRPRLVINCSNLHAADKRSIHLLLCCLEEAMKRKGDVKLAAVPHTTRALLESAGVGRLFEMFETEIDAVRSFQRRTFATAAQALVLRGGIRVSENAA
jgi:anti-anti-sigma regulatory factor